MTIENFGNKFIDHVFKEVAAEFSTGSTNFALDSTGAIYKVSDELKQEIIKEAIDSLEKNSRVEFIEKQLPALLNQDENLVKTIEKLEEDSINELIDHPLYTLWFTLFPMFLNGMLQGVTRYLANKVLDKGLVVDIEQVVKEAPGIVDEMKAQIKQIEEYRKQMSIVP